MLHPTASSWPDARWEHFSHDADVGVRGIGPTMASAFEQAAIALCAVVTDTKTISHTGALSTTPLKANRKAPKQPESEVHVQIQLEAENHDFLFLDWLNSIIYEMDSRQTLFSRAAVQIEDDKLNADLYGERMNKHKHDLAVEVKGATMTELKVVFENGQWVAQCIVDV